MKFEIDIPRRKLKEMKNFFNQNMDCDFVSDVKTLRELFIVEDRQGVLFDLRGKIGNHSIIKIKKIKRIKKKNF